MDTIAVYIIALGAAIFVALPFFLKSRDNGKEALDGAQTNPDPVLDKIISLENQKENLYSAIRDIDFDHGLGKLSEEDYKELRNKYRGEAAAVLREIDRLGSHSSFVDKYGDIEEEISSIRKSAAPLNDDVSKDDIEAEIMRIRGKDFTNGCPECGNDICEEDLFCSKCGHKINTG